MAADYDFKEIEERWSQKWIGDKAWRSPRLPDPATKRYALTMFPYPSGVMHMGHVEVFSIHDSIARNLRMRGHQVLNPLGFDAFGLPAENAAIQRGIHPKTWTYSNIDKLFSSAQRLGCSFDWERTFRTCDPSYYRWNQWFFLRFYERGLAYRRQAPAWWCPNDKTVLANEQVIAGRCERCDAVVEKRYLTQWFFKITDYADRLLDDMKLNAGWTERLKSLQSNWIGRSFGAEVEFEIEGQGPVTVYTTRPDTLWGATFFVVSPEHPMAERLVAGTELEAEFASFKDEVSRLTEIDRTATERPKKGMFLGRYAVNPVNGEKIPIWAADYVMIDYGTGAIMAVPAHDHRDFEFARQYDIEIRTVIEPLEPAAASPDEPYIGPGVMVNSGAFNGTPVEVAVGVVTEWLEAEGLGRVAEELPHSRLAHQPPALLGHADSDRLLRALRRGPGPRGGLAGGPARGRRLPSHRGGLSAGVRHGVGQRRLSQLRGAARRETDTMDTFVDSSWYFNRYVDPHNEELPFDPEVADAWMPADQYTGGIEHAVLHLIYARFFQKVLVDLGMASAPGAVPQPPQPGHDHDGRQAHVEEPRQSGRPIGGIRTLRRRCVAPVHAVLRPP